MSLRKLDKVIQPTVASNMLKANKEVPKVTKGLAHIISCAGEVFLAEMIKKITNNGETELNCDTIIKTIQTTKEYDFLIPMIQAIQEAADEEGMRKKKSKDDDE